eukprot:g3667.t1
MLGLAVAVLASASPAYRELYADMPVDHFDNSTDTFRLRYLVPAAEPWPPQTAVPGTTARAIFLYCGNEGGIDAFWQSSGFLFDAAPRHGDALVVFAEHRFYGTSLPYGAATANATAAEMERLTIEQALADYVALIEQLRAALGHTAESPVPVIAFGGSYGGWLSAWLRMAYPHACDGALAASANLPLAAGLVDEFAFFGAVTDDYKRADPACPARVRAGFARFEQLETARDWAALRRTLRLCDGQLSSPEQARLLYLWMMNGFTTIAQVDYPYPAALPVGWPVGKACATVAAGAAAGDDPLAAFAGVMGIPYNASYGVRQSEAAADRVQRCFEPLSQFHECADQTGCFAPHDPWGYQTCTEALYATSTNNVTDMFPPRQWRLRNITEYCAAEWPGATARPGWLRQLYGGGPKDWANVSNIIFSNGLLDPWHKGGVLQNVSDTVVAVVIEDGAHHYDLRGADDRDTAAVRAARAVEERHIARWIAQARLLAVQQPETNGPAGPADADAGAGASFDVVVYDATSGGVMAAVSAARLGMRTALLCASWPACFPEGGQRVGGMSSGGLGQTDYGSHPEIIGGLAREFYERNRRSYGALDGVAEDGSSCRLPQPGCNATFNLEPGRAEQVFNDMLAEAGVSVLFSAQVQSVQKTGARVRSITLEDGRAFSAGVWVDASYEGDLFARAGVSYSVGREAQSDYNETLAGMSAGAHSNQFNVAVDPFDARTGAPLPLTALPVPGAVVGGGDKMVQSYNFRLCVTKNASNLVPWPKPANYSAERWELLRRYTTACAAAHERYRQEGSGRGAKGALGFAAFAAVHCQLGFPSCNTAPVPGAKYDSNNCGGLSSDFIGQSWRYPEASYAERQEIWRAHADYHQGLLWTMAHDTGVPASVRAEMAQWGLCADEFGDNALARHWPPSLYVRAARRLRGAQLFTQNTPAEQRAGGSIGDLSVGLGGYNFDSHNAQRLACRNASACYGAGPTGSGPATPFAWDEGDVQIAPGVYQIPLWALLPRAAEASNVLVVAAPSATHVGMSTLRMEPQFMIVGHAAGAVAALAVNGTGDGNVHAVAPKALRATLLQGGMLLDLPAPPASYSYVCLQRRCVQRAGDGGSQSATCGGQCDALAPNEWLALDEFFDISGGTGGANATMVVNKAAPAAGTYLKKSELHSSTLPAAELKAVQRGDRFALTSWTALDDTYMLVALQQ